MENWRVWIKLVSIKRWNEQMNFFTYTKAFLFANLKIDKKLDSIQNFEQIRSHLHAFSAQKAKATSCAIGERILVEHFVEIRLE